MRKQVFRKWKERNDKKKYLLFTEKKHKVAALVRNKGYG